MSDEQLRTMYAKVLAAREPLTRDDCVPPEALLALVERRGSEAERLRTLDHAMSCPACGRDLALLRAVHTTRPRTVRHLAPLVLAASVLIATGVMLTARARRERQEPDLMRGGNAVSLVSPAAAATVAFPAVLIWHRVPSATSYDVRILDGGGTRVVQRTTIDTTVTLGVDASLRPDVDYAWTVTAHLPDNAEQRSVAATFRLRAR